MVHGTVAISKKREDCCPCVIAIAGYCRLHNTVDNVERWKNVALCMLQSMSYVSVSSFLGVFALLMAFSLLFL